LRDTLSAERLVSKEEERRMSMRVREARRRWAAGVEG